MEMIKDEYGWRPPYTGVCAWNHFDTEDKARAAYEDMRTRMVTELTYNGKTYRVGDMVVLYGRSSYDAPTPFTVCSHIWAIDQGGDGLEPVLVVWDEDAHDYTAATPDNPSGMLQPYGLVSKNYPADSSYPHGDIRIVHHERIGPDIIVTTGDPKPKLGKALRGLTDSLGEDESPFTLVAALTVSIDGELFCLGDTPGPKPPCDLMERIRVALGMSEDEWEAMV